jgi:hypothetical protein
MGRGSINNVLPRPIDARADELVPQKLSGEANR